MLSSSTLSLTKVAITLQRLSRLLSNSRGFLRQRLSIVVLIIILNSQWRALCVLCDRFLLPLSKFEVLSFCQFCRLPKHHPTNTFLLNQQPRTRTTNLCLLHNSNQDLDLYLCRNWHRSVICFSKISLQKIGGIQDCDSDLNGVIHNVCVC